MQRYGSRRDVPQVVQCTVGRRDRALLQRQDRQGDEGRAVIATKGIWLIIPIEISQGASITKQMMLRLLVIPQHHVEMLLINRVHDVS